MSEFNYLLEQGQKRTPARFTANSFSDLSKAILSKRVQISITPEMTKAERRKEKEKLWWFSPPTKEAGQRRIVSNMAACTFGGADIDDSTPGAIQMLIPVLKRYSMLVYQTASHTAENPRLRIVPEYSRLVEPEERRAIGEAVETLLMQEAGFTIASIDGDTSRWVNGSDYVILDRSVYGAQSYHYCPDMKAEAFTFEGEVINVDARPLSVTAPGTSTTRGKKNAQEAAGVDSDPFPTVPDEFTISDLRSALSFPKWQNPSDDYETWAANGIRLASLKGTEYEDDAKALWHEYSARSPAWREDYTEKNGRVSLLTVPATEAFLRIRRLWAGRTTRLNALLPVCNHGQRPEPTGFTISRQKLTSRRERSKNPPCGCVLPLRDDQDQSPGSAGGLSATARRFDPLECGKNYRLAVWRVHHAR
ncbi:hypothetical protein ACFFJN_06125 [Erwinia mallotivora]|uniref:hypothetical protein n=1 Tax=Erwinia mallotivora TaxID=69222 RepID=UPI0035E6FF45